jgi:hypothetical protein
MASLPKCTILVDRSVVTGKVTLPQGMYVADLQYRFLYYKALKTIKDGRRLAIDLKNRLTTGCYNTIQYCLLLTRK